MHRVLFLLLFSDMLFAQTIPVSRSVDWISAQPISDKGEYSQIVIGNNVLSGDGVTPNDDIFDLILAQVVPGHRTRIVFRSGNFLFNRPVVLSSDIVLKGKGADLTTFTMDLKGTDDAFKIKGRTGSLKDTLIYPAYKNDNFVIVMNPGQWKKDDWMRISMQDTDLVTSDWAYNSVGQILQLTKIAKDTLFFKSPLRLDIELERIPVITQMIPVENVGIECLSIKRVDDTAPQQSSNILFENAVNCWVSGIESTNCTFAHLTITNSSGIQVRKSYFHDGFDYGGGGRAYAVVMQFTTGECLIENNIFSHLRHSVLLQAGANGNVVAYNYSRDPFWSGFPADAAGDMVLHGNYVFANLFEQNICQNIVIDDSHGPNGPLNTFFRNRAEKYGIYFSAMNSPFQNIVGNEITNNNFPYNLVNYTIQGADQFEYGNNNKGEIIPSGTEAVPEKSLFYNEKPYFLTDEEWGGIGSSNEIGHNNIPAFDRWMKEMPMVNACVDSLVLSNRNFNDESIINCYPSPFNAELSIESKTQLSECIIFDGIGRIVFRMQNIEQNLKINTSNWPSGFYFVHISSGNTIKTVKLIKI